MMFPINQLDLTLDFNEVSIFYKDKSMNDETLTIKRKSEISDEIVDRVIKKLN